jgi:hypothetical protein
MAMGTVNRAVFIDDIRSSLRVAPRHEPAAPVREVSKRFVSFYPI